MAACIAASSSASSLGRFNNFLSLEDVDRASNAIILLMMAANRISLASLALQQARNLRKLLKSLPAHVSSNLTNQSESMGRRMRKEIVSLGENLAQTLASRRHYGAPTDRPGVFEIDPRFLLFEFSHGLLLRKSQVELIRQLIADMAQGKSVCHQVAT